MTDALTDAVRRLKGLREDVERLKAAQSEEGEIRLFFASDELAMASDAASVRGADVTASDVAAAADALSLRGPDVVETETATATDAADVRGTTLTAATWNSAGYTTSTYNDGN